MDLATVLGLLLAWGAVFVALLLEGGSFKDMFSAPAAVLVIFGTIGATVIGSSMKTILATPSMLKRAIFSDTVNLNEIIDTMVSYARIARRNGILALEDITRDLDDKFVRKGIELIIDGTPSALVREIMETELVAMQERQKSGAAVFTTLGGFSPTLGIIGTVMGLIGMLAKLSEPNKVGHAIASAFLATLYGVALANLAYLPIATKLKARASEELLGYEMIIEGILSIQSGDSPRMVEERMVAFLPPEARAERQSDSSRPGGKAIAA